MRVQLSMPVIRLLLLVPLAFSTLYGQPRGAVRVPVAATLEALIADEDTDGDKKITIDDPRLPGTPRGDRRFSFLASNGQRFEVAGTYYLSNLLAALKLAEESGRDSADLTYENLFEPPVEHIARCIRKRYWRELTRTIDEKGLARIFRDEKSTTKDGLNYVYVPHDDSLAGAYFREIARRRPEWKIQIVTLPAVITGNYARHLDGRHGILTLRLRTDSSGAIGGTPFVVPGGRFNEMYGWDSYFIVLGLLHDGYVSLARSIVDNFVYEIAHYDKILNANRTYYLTRSQPPFLTSMALAVSARIPHGHSRKAWLHSVVEAAIHEYDSVWTSREHLTGTGLSRYYDTGFGPPPEVEPGRFDSLFAQAAREQRMLPAAFEETFSKGLIHSPELERFFRNDRAMRESGHDASYRLLDRCADLVTVDLNALLYKTESDLATIIAHEFNGSLSVSGTVQRAEDWRLRAQKRRELVNQFLWNEERGMFFDYDVVTQTQTNFESATTFYPLWAGLASEGQSARLVKNALPLLTMPGGIAGSTERSRGPVTPARQQTQWDYPFGWAPHQMLVWSGLERYHYDSLARDLAYRWLYTITLNAYNYNGTIAEKYDVASRSAQVFAEYGNVGTKFSYITREGFGWTNASFVLGLSRLMPGQREDLNRLVAPEWHKLREPVLPEQSQ
jgi:alpha,alpha-trehalase